MIFLQMKLIDAHAHVDKRAIQGMQTAYGSDHSLWLSKILENAENVGVKAIIGNGTNVESNRDVFSLSQTHEIIKPALGFYPNEIEKVSEEELDVELEHIKKQKNSVIALGEVGLDKKYDKKLITSGEWKSLYKKQTAGFEKIIQLSEKTKLPLLLHTRKAEQDVVDLLESSTVKNPMMHCFCGKKKLVKRIADNGWNVSIPVTVIKLQQFQEMTDIMPLSQLLTETDTPFLGPEPGPTNEPANVALSIKKMAEIKKIEVQEMADQVFLNYMRLFSPKT